VNVLQHVAFAVFLVVTAITMAHLEVQIEGAAGWAQNLPTWRIDTPITRFLLGGRALTGYHLYFHLFIALMLHAPFAIGLLRITPGAELRLLSFLVLFWLLEDFFWFIINPAYGWRAFRADRIRWHRHTWWGIMPREYWLAAPIGLILYALSFRF
jgi:hypothetical protein